jgi:hypothetical protein
VALIAPFAQVARSTNRSTLTMAIVGCQLQNVTAFRPISACPRPWHKAPERAKRRKLAGAVRRAKSTAVRKVCQSLNIDPLPAKYPCR